MFAATCMLCTRTCKYSTLWHARRGRPHTQTSRLCGRSCVVSLLSLPQLLPFSFILHTSCMRVLCCSWSSLMSCCSHHLGAFFIRRGNKSEPHSALQRRLVALQEDDHEREEGEQSCQNRFEGEASGVTPRSTSVAGKLEGETSFVFLKSIRRFCVLAVIYYPPKKKPCICGDVCTRTDWRRPGQRLTACSFHHRYVGPISIAKSALVTENNPDTRKEEKPAAPALL